MTRSTTTVATSNASKYLTQLSKHWSHRFPDLTYTAERADIPLPGGPCVLTADPQALHIVIDGSDAQTAERLEGVVAEHLRRFAFREDLTFDWVREAG
ncbi:hypothetical protein KOAAANKH_00892 [Brevundimonas sp. NIBR10]|uniref:DUF2218 domain-containing protein n=1 Tax=Brevundimonas sp. NIBR10 TaxID=3015997 RepID=UPI0022F185E3|nr:DUF2218 domain-containing protein [Brevundimonas sp. NIBR10]WGM46027.1 hypothetical protein KOAAANKH_00892 [Brevundimonas sp. NIBR10]